MENHYLEIDILEDVYSAHGTSDIPNDKIKILIQFSLTICYLKHNFNITCIIESDQVLIKLWAVLIRCYGFSTSSALIGK